MSSCTLEALLSQTVRLIKSSQPGLEFLSQFSPKKNTRAKKPKMFHFESNIVGFPCKQLSTARDSCAKFFDAFTVRGLFVRRCYATFGAVSDSDIRHSPGTKACLCVVSLLFTSCVTEQAGSWLVRKVVPVSVFSVEQQVQICPAVCLSGLQEGLSGTDCSGLHAICKK